MAIINVRRVRDAFVRAKVTDAADGLELSTSLDKELSETVVSKERLETMEQRLDARFAESDSRNRVQFAEMNARFAQADANAERRANRHTTIFLAALALAVGVIALLMIVL
ncbi:MAG: hypothetical protein OXD50_01395 [Chloroflexi bacterium]|nr:hypothetical protein [Chloroflexota bacterium]